MCVYKFTSKGRDTRAYTGNTLSAVGVASCAPALRVKAMGHRNARHDKTVLFIERPFLLCEFTTQDCRQQKIRRLNTFRAMVQITPAHQTRHRQDRLVVCGVVVWIDSSRPADKCVVGPTQFTPPQQTRQDYRACLSTAAAAMQADRPHAATLYATQNVNTLWTVAYD